ncbi:hypothetical protein ACOSQ2_032084 [Xanthoceras sorbifolium]
MQTILTELQALRVNSSTHLSNPPESFSQNQNYSHNAHDRTQTNIKLNFPTFGGDNRTGWIYKAEQYFEFKDIAYHQRSHYNGTGGTLNSRDLSMGRVHLRFGPTDYEDPLEALSWLKQMTTVQSYQEAFEKLSHRVDNLPKSFLIGCFIAGLRDDIRLDVKVKQPRTLADTIGVARLIKERNILQKKMTSNFRPLQALSTPRNSPPTAANPRPEIPLHAMSGTSHPETIRVVGRMKNKDVIVFIDGGSTHNFIDHSTTTKLALPIVSDKTFQVMVGNGEQIECKGRSLGLILVIQGCLITTDFYILPVAACQVVLGVQWL